MDSFEDPNLLSNSIVCPITQFCIVFWLRAAIWLAAIRMDFGACDTLKEINNCGCKNRYLKHVVND